MDTPNYTLIKNQEHNYHHLDPIPSDDVLGEFYQSQYPELLEEGELAEDVSRLLSDGDGAEAEREWRCSTWYRDYLYIIRNQCPDANRVLDVGCGTGEFLHYIENNGYEAVGIEPSKRIGEAARNKGLTIYQDTVEQFVKSQDAEFDVISMYNVLEHVPNPHEVLRAVKELLIPGGVFIIKVPNEFNSFQMAAASHLDLDRWWITAPTHIFYFNFDSLRSLLNDTGFDVFQSMADFPMSLFLLMGEDYVTDSGIGTDCHNRRVSFEQSIHDETRREFYSQLADAKLGRNCTLFATV